MSAINLSGIKAVKPPAALFDEYFRYKENHFSGAAYPEGDSVKVQVVWDRDNKFQTKEEPALAVQLDNCIIGYIPVLSTIERYINAIWKQRGEAMARMDADEVNRLMKKWEWQSDRYKWAHMIRGYIETDLFINHIPVEGTLSNVLVSDDGEVLSVSVDFDLM